MEANALQTLVQFTFFVGYIAMGAAFIFFLVERGSVAPEHRTAVTISALIVGIAAFHYYYMKSTYVPGQDFPTEYRYIDWIITTPLMLIKFPVLIGLRQGAGSLLAKLVVLDVIMILTGYLGEIGIAPLPMWIVGTLAWFGIIGLLFTTVKGMASTADEATRGAIKTLSGFVTIGWAIYPIGYLVRFYGGDMGADITQLVYNIGDAVNKIGFGLVVWYAARAASRSAERRTATA
jgi:bacteriorhodopsin